MSGIIFAYQNNCNCISKINHSVKLNVRLVVNKKKFTTYFYKYTYRNGTETNLFIYPFLIDLKDVAGSQIIPCVRACVCVCVLINNR